MASTRGQVYHNLSVMLAAGIPLLRALRTAVSSLRGPLPKAFLAVAKNVSAGTSLAEAMSKQHKVFTALDVLVVEVAEVSGNLPESLKLLAEWYELCSRLRRIIISGMMLPVLLLHIAAFISPLPGVFLGGSSATQYVQQVIQILLVGYVPAGVILGVVYLAPKIGLVRRLLDALVLRIPVLGRAVRELALCRYCRMFYMLYKAGVPVVQCAQKASEVTGNATVTSLLKGAADSARLGNPLSEGFSRKLPEDFLQLWQVGEESGKLDDSVGRLAQATTESAELIFTELARWLPRVAYLLVCILMIKAIFTNFQMILTAG